MKCESLLSGLIVKEQIKQQTNRDSSARYNSIAAIRLRPSRKSRINLFISMWKFKLFDTERNLKCQILKWTADLNIFFVLLVVISYHQNMCVCITKPFTL